MKNNKISLTTEQIEFIWWLGFTSGRVEGNLHPNMGVSYVEEQEYWKNDLGRVLVANPRVKSLDKLIKDEFKKE